MDIILSGKQMVPFPFPHPIFPFPLPLFPFLFPFSLPLFSFLFPFSLPSSPFLFPLPPFLKPIPPFLFPFPSLFFFLFPFPSPFYFFSSFFSSNPMKAHIFAIPREGDGGQAEKFKPPVFLISVWFQGYRWKSGIGIFESKLTVPFITRCQ